MRERLLTKGSYTCIATAHKSRS